MCQILTILLVRSRGSAFWLAFEVIPTVENPGMLCMLARLVTLTTT